jgi:outer membrane immunogenic protein
MAADMPLKAPPPVVTTYDWSGYYLGFSAGWSSDKFDWAFNPAIPGAVHQAYTLRKNQAIIDVHAGAQWQYSWFVAGVEGSVSSGNFLQATEIGYGINAAAISTAKRQELYQAGVRLGVAWDRWLAYATGGWAQAAIATGCPVNCAGGFLLYGAQTTHQGWYAGGGLEYMLAKGALVDVIVGGEYQHYAFDTRLHCPTGFACPDFASFNSRNINDTVDVVRARISIKWNPYPAAPVYAKY